MYLKAEPRAALLRFRRVTQLHLLLLLALLRRAVLVHLLLKLLRMTFMVNLIGPSSDGRLWCDDLEVKLSGLLRNFNLCLSWRQLNIFIGSKNHHLSVRRLMLLMRLTLVA